MYGCCIACNRTVVGSACITGGNHMVVGVHSVALRLSFFRCIEMLVVLAELKLWLGLDCWHLSLITVWLYLIN